MDINTIRVLHAEGVFEGLYVECPDCGGIDDEQYTCTTCWSQGGNARIDVNDIIDTLLNRI